MNKDQEFIFSARQQLNQMLRQLEQGKVLTQEDCALGEQWLTALAEKVAEPKTISEPKLTEVSAAAADTGLNVSEAAIVETTDSGSKENLLGTLMQQFEAHASNTAEHFRQMADVVSSGRVPENKEMAELETSVLDLRSRYASIRQLAEQELYPEEMPGENAPVQEFAHALANSAKARYAKLLLPIQETLEQFIAVRSSVDECTTALRPYQEQASELMKNLKVRNDQDLASIQEQAVLPETFLAAVSCQDVFSAEGQALYDKINLLFQTSRIVPIGIMRGSYQIDTEALEQLRKGRASVTAVAEEAPVKEERMEISAEGAVRKEYTPTDFAEAVTAAGLLLDPEQDFLHFAADLPESSEKKITAHIFVNDMMGGNQSIERAIVCASSVFPVFNAELLSCHTKKFTKDAIQTSLMYMHRKGYLRKYMSEQMGDFYEPTERLVHGLSYQTSAKYMKLLQKKWPTSVRGTAPIVTAGLCRMKLSADSGRRFASFAQSVVTKGEAFDQSIVSCECTEAAESPRDIVLGAFWTDTSECERFAAAVPEIVHGERPTNLIFAGIDRDHAKSLADVCHALFDLPTTNTITYLYDLREQAYFTYPELQETGVVAACFVTE